MSDERLPSSMENFKNGSALKVAKRNTTKTHLKMKLLALVWLYLALMCVCLLSVYWCIFTVVSSVCLCSVNAACPDHIHSSFFVWLMIILLPWKQAISHVQRTR